MSDDEISAISTPEAKKRFHFVEFEEVDSEQKAEFQRLLKKVCIIKINQVKETTKLERKGFRNFMIHSCE